MTSGERDPPKLLMWGLIGVKSDQGQSKREAEDLRAEKQPSGREVGCVTDERFVDLVELVEFLHVAKVWVLRLFSG